MINKIKNQYNPDVVSAPGETLLEILQTVGMTQSDLAKRMGRPIKTVNEIIKGKTAITPESALQLEKVLRVPARFWNNRERIYREFLAKADEQKKLSENLAWLKSIPVDEMVKLDWIEKAINKIEQISLVLQFFGIAGVEQWKKIWTEPLAVYRKSKTFKSSIEALSVWLRKGEIESQQIICSSYKKPLFNHRLLEIRRLVKEPDPSIFIPRLVKLCSEAGVAVVFIPELKGVRTSGATYWLSSHKAVIQLSLRYKTNDHLWFTFFHESGHILLHEKQIIVEGINGKEELEQEADMFSSNFLIDNQKYNEFISKKDFSKISVTNFAIEVNTAPGIVVGRLQHDNCLPYSHLNDLKISYRWNIPNQSLNRTGKKTPPG